MPSNHLILCCSLFLLPSIFPSIRVFSTESALDIRWPKYWRFSFSFSISPLNEYSGLISLKFDLWFDLLAIQGTLKSFLQHHSLKASILQHSAFFMVQLSTSINAQLLSLVRLLQFKDWSQPGSSVQARFSRQENWSGLLFPSPSIHDYWKNHSFDYVNPCWQSDISVFFFFYKKTFALYWTIVDLQCCVSFKCAAKWLLCTYLFFFKFFLFRLLQNIKQFPVIYAI